MSEETKTDVAVDPQGTETVTVEQTTEQDTKSFSQEDVNAIAAKESKKATEKMLKDLGIEDFDNAKDGLDKFKEWQESQKTEAEKQAEQLSQLSEKAQALESEKSQLEAKVTALGLGVEAESLNDVIALANTYVNDEMPMDKAIEQVLEKYPQFKAGGTIPPSRQTVKPGNPQRVVPGETDAFKEAAKKYI